MKQMKFAISVLVIVSVFAGGVKAQSSAPSAAFVLAKVIEPPQYFSMGGTCTTEISPSEAVILGGVSSAALKPDDAIAELDKQLGLMKSYVSEKHGEIQMMERARTLKNPQPGIQKSDPPFQVVQRLQILLPANAPVDAILEKLIELGFDRFGDNVLNNYNRREIVIRYRFADFDAKLKELQKECIADAWAEWCSTQTSKGICDSKTPPPELDVQWFNVRSKEALMRAEGSSAPWQFTFNRGQRPPEAPELMGNVTVHLIGNINLTYRGEEEKP